MERYVYYIEGFDCPACAVETEEAISKDPSFASVRIDTVTSKIFLQMNEALPLEEIERRINEVSDDEIHMLPLSEKKKTKLWNKETKILLLRILYCIGVFFVCAFSLRDVYWVRFGLYLSAYVLISYDVYMDIFHNIARRKNPIDDHLLMALASAGAFVLASLQYAFEGSAASFQNSFFLLEGHMEAIFVMGLYQIGEVIEKLASNHAQKQIEAAFAMEKGDSRLLLEEGSVLVDSESLREGDRVLVRRGEELYVDGEVLEGEAYCNTSALNGEFEPAKVSAGSAVYGGYVIEEGEIIVRASADYASSARGKIEAMLSEAGSAKSRAERFISSFARVYTPIVFAIAVLYIAIAGFASMQWREATFTGLEIMVISCPCAVVISVPLAFLASLGAASKEGILMKNVGVIDDLKDINRFVSDKTGTLTEGKFSLKEALAIKSEETLFRAASISESYSLHPLGKAVLASCAQQEVPDTYEEIDGKGTVATKEGITYLAGSKAFLEERGFVIAERKVAGKVVYFASSEEGYLGALGFEDAPRPGTKLLVQKLKESGIKTMILSGDNNEHVQAFSTEIGLDESLAELSPEGKLNQLKTYLDRGEKVLYLGDGSNDAPCLGLGTVGVAIGEARTALAVTGADAIILNNKPELILRMFEIAARARRVALFNVVAALTVKAAMLVLTIVLNGRMPMEAAIIADSGMMVLLTLNSLRLLRAKR